jgi:hypothetical protein
LLLYPAVFSLLLCDLDRTKISSCSVAIVEKRIVEEKADKRRVMEMFTNSTTWLQQQQQQQSQQQAQSSDSQLAQRPSVDWKEPSTSSGNGAPPSAQGNIDLNDSDFLGDLPSEYISVPHFLIF